jgi:Putative peptidase family
LLLAHFGREAAKAASHSLKTPFQDYFLPKNADAVINVFSNVLGKAPETGNDKYISNVFFKCIDTDKDCAKNPDWAAYNKATSHGGAAESDIVICDHGWVAARELRFPKITCKEVGKQVSDVTMDSFGRMVLHEMLSVLSINGVEDR